MLQELIYTISSPIHIKGLKLQGLKISLVLQLMTSQDVLNEHNSYYGDRVNMKCHYISFSYNLANKTLKYVMIKRYQTQRMKT